MNTQSIKSNYDWLKIEHEKLTDNEKGSVLGLYKTVIEASWKTLRQIIPKDKLGKLSGMYERFLLALCSENRITSETDKIIIEYAFVLMYIMYIREQLSIYEV